MDHPEWAAIVKRHNVNWPAQQIEPLTETDWYGPLSSFPAREVWDAIDRHRQDITPGRDGMPAGHWAPSLAGILACIETNWREAAAARRELEADAARAARNRSHGDHTPPPEIGRIVEVLKASMYLPDHPDHLPAETARKRIEQLDAELNERVALEQAGQLT